MNQSIVFKQQWLTANTELVHASLLFTKSGPGWLLKTRAQQLLTFQQLSEGLGARGRDGEGQFVHGDAIRYSQGVDLSVGDLAGQQLPQ